jgi:S1-C subfamily serine protease
MQRVVIKHISGSKAEQVEEFPADQFKALTLGRNTDQIIRYDPDKDDLVSRQHARIAREEDQEDRFFIADVGSSHGTYVNKHRISGTASLLPGDVIQLGPGGPEFQFDLEPRPDGMIRPTREITQMRETRESATSSALANPPTRPSVGQATVERMLGQYQQSSRKTLINLAAALVGVTVIVTGVLVYLNLMTKREMATRYDSLDKQLKVAQELVTANQNTSPTDPTMSPAEIAKHFGPATVYIEVSGKLIDARSDQQVYHRYEKGKENEKYPVYLHIDKAIFPWLSTENVNNANIPITMSSAGSGFVVANNGFILTNRHVAAMWHTSYANFPAQPSIVYDVDPKTGRVLHKDFITDRDQLQQMLSQAHKWVPANTNILVEKRTEEKLVEKKVENKTDKEVQQVKVKYDVYYVVSSQFESRDRLDVTFPKNRLRIPAKLVRTSDEHDVALIKVDLPDAVPAVKTHDNPSESRPGNVITVLGYPGVSPDIGVRIKSYDPLNPAPKKQVVPNLTVTNGLIGKIIPGNAIPKGGTASDYISPGDLIQLTVNATGAGNSGGPVFDDRGRVIGIFTYGIPGDVQISAAVPIHYGLNIMGLKPVFD